MDSSMSLVLFLACSFFLRGTVAAEVICEDLGAEKCSFAIASSGKRCVLENYKNREGDLVHFCKTSGVVAEKLSGYIETDQCVRACGVDRKSAGISSDEFLVPQFTKSLCSSPCYQNCPNIVDLYFNLASGEGVYLPTLCKKLKVNSRRAMMKPYSISTGAASGLVGADSPSYSLTSAPAPL